MTALKCPMCGGPNLKNLVNSDGNQDLFLPYVDTSQNPPLVDLGTGQKVRMIVCVDCETAIPFVPGVSKK